jgi:hypothetical protein
MGRTELPVKLERLVGLPATRKHSKGKSHIFILYHYYMEIVTDFSSEENDSMGIILYLQGVFWNFMGTV